MINSGDGVSGNTADAWDGAARELETHVAPSAPVIGSGQRQATLTNKPFHHEGAAKLFESFEECERAAKRAVRRGQSSAMLYHDDTQLGVVLQTAEGLIVTDLYPEGCVFA